jgi:hypothetical protein
VVNLSKLRNKNKLGQKANYYQQDLKLLKASIYYFYKLRNENKISNEVLNNLTRYSCSVFIETQIESTIQNTLEKNLAKFLVSELGLSDNEVDFDVLYSFEESSKIIESLKKIAYV